MPFDRLLSVYDPAVGSGLPFRIQLPGDAFATASNYALRVLRDVPRGREFATLQLYYRGNSLTAGQEDVRGVLRGGARLQNTAPETPETLVLAADSPIDFSEYVSVPERRPPPKALRYPPFAGGIRFWWRFSEQQNDHADVALADEQPGVPQGTALATVLQYVEAWDYAYLRLDNGAGTTLDIHSSVRDPPFGLGGAVVVAPSVHASIIGVLRITPGRVGASNPFPALAGDRSHLGFLPEHWYRATGWAEELLGDVTVRFAAPVQNAIAAGKILTFIGGGAFADRGTSWCELASTDVFETVDADLEIVRTEQADVILPWGVERPVLGRTADLSSSDPTQTERDWTVAAVLDRLEQRQGVRVRLSRSVPDAD